MKGPYLETHELKQLNELLGHAVDSTLGCWIATRLNGASASMACDGNISLVLLKALDDKIMPFVEKAKRNPYQEGLDRVATTPMPEGQKYPIGARVRIADDLGPSMSHFSGKGKEATVQYTYGHAYGGDVKTYSLDIDSCGSCAWYNEDQLTLITEKDDEPTIYELSIKLAGALHSKAVCLTPEEEKLLVAITLFCGPHKENKFSNINQR